MHKTLDKMPTVPPTSHRQSHFHYNQNLPSFEKTLSQTKQLHSSFHTSPHTPSKHTPPTTTSCTKNQVRILIRIHKNTSDSQAIHIPTYSLPPLTPISCPQKTILAYPHIKSHNPTPQVYPTLTSHIIPYNQKYQPQTSPKLHKQTCPRKYRNLLFHDQILTKIKPITPNNSLYASFNTPLSTTPALIHLILIHNNAHTLIMTQTDTSTPQTIRTKTSSPPPAKRKAWPQSPPNICPPKTTHDCTPQLPLALNPHTLLHT